MAGQRREKRRLRGKTNGWSEAELDKLSEVGPSDVESAQDRWSRFSDGFDGLLDAEPEEET